LGPYNIYIFIVHFFRNYFSRPIRWKQKQKWRKWRWWW